MQHSTATVCLLVIVVLGFVSITGNYDEATTQTQLS